MGRVVSTSGLGTGELDAGTLSEVDCLAAFLVGENSLKFGMLGLGELLELSGGGVVTNSASSNVGRRSSS